MILKVWDNQGDKAEFRITITVELKTVATELPKIDALSPDIGLQSGGTIVTITG